jgi:hypothetical protein
MLLPVVWSEDLDMDCIKTIVADLESEFIYEHKRHRYPFLLQYLSFSAPPKIFERLKFSPNTKAAIDRVNSSPQKKGRSVWQYDHIAEDGYTGIKIGPEHDMDEPMTPEDFIRTWILSMWLTEAASWRDLVGTRSAPSATATGSSEAARQRW